VLDYARTFGLKATVFRMSCIYGPHQFGTEDQGWVAHFIIQALKRRPLTLYGDGLQVRDVLFVEDLVDAMLLSQQRIDQLSGQAFNIGGGHDNSVSLLELIDVIGDRLGRRPAYRLEPWRTADQRYYVSDTSKFARATGWAPRVPVSEGVQRLTTWLLESGTLGLPALAGGRVAS
jgi:CDP-paratose 2-epimerase